MNLVVQVQYSRYNGEKGTHQYKYKYKQWSARKLLEEVIKILSCLYK